MTCLSLFRLPVRIGFLLVACSMALLPGLASAQNIAK